MKIAVVLFNLGGPDDLSAVKPFLFNLFKDYNIIRLPAFFRYPLAYLISRIRYQKAEKIYQKLGGKSPINDQTECQRNALENALNTNGKNDYHVFFCMQYWHPMHDEVIDQVDQVKPDQLILLPLYPQYSTTTTKSSLSTWIDKTKQRFNKIPTLSVCCYPENKGYVSAYGELACDELMKLTHKFDQHKTIILYSAHGIPIDCIKRGDPYQSHVEKSAQAIHNYITKKGFDLNFLVTYQSKVGPKEWLQPDTEQIIKKYSENNHNILVIPLAFTSEHSETLVELDMDYKDLAYQFGCKEYRRVPAITDHPLFIKGIAEDIEALMHSQLDRCQTICSNEYRECPKKILKTSCISI